MRLFVKIFLVFVLTFLFMDLIYSQEGMEIIRKMARGDRSVLVELTDFDKVEGIERVEVRLFGLLKKDKKDRKLLELRTLDKKNNKTIFVLSEGNYELEFSIPSSTNDVKFTKKLFVKGNKRINVKQSVLGFERGVVLYCGFEGEDEIKSLGGVINRFYRNDYEEITFVDGYRGKGMWVRGDTHADVGHVTFDQVFLPVDGLMSERGTIEFMFKPIGWDSNDGCPVHYLITFVEKTNGSDRFHNWVNGKSSIEFGWWGWGHKFISRFFYRTFYKEGFDNSWGVYSKCVDNKDLDNGYFKFSSDEWIRFRIVWDRECNLPNDKFLIVYANGEEIISLDGKFEEGFSPMMKFISIGSAGFQNWYGGKDANMYLNAAGVFDELYVYNYPKLD